MTPAHWNRHCRTGKGEAWTCTAALLIFQTQLRNRACWMTSSKPVVANCTSWVSPAYHNLDKQASVNACTHGKLMTADHNTQYTRAGHISLLLVIGCQPCQTAEYSNLCLQTCGLALGQYAAFENPQQQDCVPGYPPPEFQM